MEKVIEVPTNTTLKHEDEFLCGFIFVSLNFGVFCVDLFL